MVINSCLCIIKGEYFRDTLYSIKILSIFEKKLMKRIFTTSIIIIAITLGMSAQSFEVYNNSDEIITGETITVATTIDITSNFYFKVKNTAGGVKTARVDIEILVGPVDESVHVVCSPITETNASGQCGMPWAVSSAPFTLNPNETSGEIHVAFSQGPNSGITTIRYKVYEEGNESDNVTFTVTYSTLTAVNVAQISDFSVYPNPAVNNFSIENNFGEESYVEIYNILGTLVSRIESNNSNAISVDCSKWQSGYYFCRLYSNKKLEKTIKLVVTD